MEFRLDEAQVGLQETVGRFCSDRFPFESVLEREGTRVDRSVWNEMAALGVFSLLLPEDAGGSGLGPLEGAIVFEQLGEHLVAGPTLWSVLGANLIDGAATGEVLVSGVSASAVEDGVALVEYGAEVDVVLVLHRDGVESFPTSELPAPVELEPLDPLTPVARLSGLSGGTRIGDASVARELDELGTVLVAAGLSGVASRALEESRSYAMERKQFDAPIGSFQAVKHMLADMYVRSGLAQSATYAAAAVLEDPTEDASGAAAAAKVVAADAAIKNASDAVQIMGGMGFTWDMAPNYLLKRAWLLEHSFGTAGDHAQVVGSSLVGSVR